MIITASHDNFIILKKFIKEDTTCGVPQTASWATPILPRMWCSPPVASSRSLVVGVVVLVGGGVCGDGWTEKMEEIGGGN
ncbi:hypothetical protein BVRB_5g123340 [Beta vulgaris subsp. vulgaris]|uniref:Uncharacterized protein n=1 Tax=Beta vulgaris subsp. vulgaris TaxID=3555 RepID=A0A0J8E402_BETVV|nr:hypothetical protein BVRB_5g123340 [Beta vulgaris subsp. vulgaris]